MSLSLVVLLPILLFGIVGVFCFAGCVFQTGGLPSPPFTQYSGLTVLGNPAIVAGYWPLGETKDTDPAQDRAPNPVNGKYIDPNTAPVPTIYPWPSVPNIPSPGGANALSADALGTLNLGQMGLVTGDAVQPLNNPAVLTTCMVVNGGYVEVPFDAKWNTASFTLEAWVRVGWMSSDPMAWRAVLDGRGQNIQDGMCKGFAIMAVPDKTQTGYQWAVILGNGGTGLMGFDLLPDSGPEIMLADANPQPEAPPLGPVYLVVTYDAASTTLTLFVNGQQTAQNTSQAFLPNTESPLYIGAGAPYVPKRQTAGSMSGGPLFPFVGAIQDVAIYNTALKPAAILSHFKNGTGTLN